MTKIYKVPNQDFTGDDDVSRSVTYKYEEDTHDYTTEVENPVPVKSRSHISQCPIPSKRRKQLISNVLPPKTATKTIMENLVKKK